MVAIVSLQSSQMTEVNASTIRLTLLSQVHNYYCCWQKQLPVQGSFGGSMESFNIGGEGKWAECKEAFCKTNKMLHV